jgi:hypothetical protein
MFLRVGAGRRQRGQRCRRERWAEPAAALLDDAKDLSPLPHVIGVQPADLLVEDHDEHLHVATLLNAAVGLNSVDSRTLLEHFQVVEAAKHVLQALQPALGGARRKTTELACEFERVAELLRRDPDSVDALGHVHPAGIVNHPRESLGPSDQLRSEHEPPLGGRQAAVELRDELGDAVGQTLRIGSLQHVQHLVATVEALDGDSPRDAVENGLQRRVDRSDLVQQFERDVEFTHSTQRPRDAAHPAAQLEQPGRLGSALQDRDRFAQPPGCHARVVDRFDFAGERQRQVVAERIEAPGECVAKALACACRCGSQHPESPHRAERLPLY